METTRAALKSKRQEPPGISKGRESSHDKSQFEFLIGWFKLDGRVVREEEEGTAVSKRNCCKQIFKRGLLVIKVSPVVVT